MPGIATLADVEAIEATPLAERNLPASTYEGILRSAEARPDQLALLFFLRAAQYKKAVRYTYREFIGRIHQTANLFTTLGIGPGDAVSYILPNLPQTYFSLIGGEAAGIANPINPLLEPETLADIMRAAETKVLVTLAPFPTTDIWPKVAGIVDQVPSLRAILQVDLAQYLSGWEKWALRLMRLRQRPAAVRVKVLDFDRAVAAQPADRLISGRVFKPDDIAAYFHTGGTTGTPKLAMHTHFNEVYDAWISSVVTGALPAEVIFCGLPLFHNFGAIATGIGAWILGSTVILGTPQGYRGEGVIAKLWEILAYYQCHTFNAVPTLLAELLRVPREGHDLSRLNGVLCGAAPLPVELFRQFRTALGAPVLEGYGLTEATSVCSINPREGEQRVGSVGYRLPYQEMRIAVIEGGRFIRFCEPDEVGVVIVRGPNVFPGYREAQHNRHIFVDSGDGRGPWLNTGDLGRQDRDGYFWLTGRQKELIIRGGHNIDPKQIEEPLHEHPAVALAAAVGRPDPRVGELPVAYVQLKPGATTTPAELAAFAAERIGERAAWPKEIRIVPELPLTAVGKIFKPTLVYEQVQEVYTTAVRGVEGVAAVQTQVSGDRRLGVVAQVQVRPSAGVERGQVEDAVRAVLGQYAVPYELKIE